MACRFGENNVSTRQGPSHFVCNECSTQGKMLLSATLLTVCMFLPVIVCVFDSMR